MQEVSRSFVIIYSIIKYSLDRNTKGRPRQDPLISDVHIIEVYESISDSSPCDATLYASDIRTVCLLCSLGHDFTLLHLLSSTGVISNWMDESRIPPCTIYQAFKYFLDITTSPSPLLLQQFALLATNEKQRKRLEVLSKVGRTNANKRSNNAWNAIIVRSRKNLLKECRVGFFFVFFYFQPNLPVLLVSLMYSDPLSDTSSARG